MELMLLKEEEQKAESVFLLKQAASKKEHYLKKKLYTRTFVLSYDLNNTDFGVFFALSGKAAINVIRNRMKRVFKEKLRLQVMPILKEKNISKFSICFISKKGVAINDRCTKGSSSYGEIEELINRLSKEV